MANFEWYRSLVAIYREGSISAAAATRFMTQPALSQHLAALEAEAGEPLFRRTSRNMVPTERGKAIYGQIVQAVDRLERVTSEFQGSSAILTIRLGGPTEYFHEQFIQRLEGMQHRLLVTFGQSRELLDLLKQSRLDIVISTQHLSVPGLQFVRFDTEIFRLAGTKEEQLSIDGEDKQTAKWELERKKWISYSDELPIIRRFWMETFGERPAFTSHQVIPDLRVIKTLILKGLGVSVLPDYLIKNELADGSLRELWTSPKPVMNELWLVYRSADRNDSALMRFIEQVSDQTGHND